jgi:hypothetical protein
MVPLLWLASAESQSHTGLRLNAKLWDENLPLMERLGPVDISGIPSDPRMWFKIATEEGDLDSARAGGCAVAAHWTAYSG